MPHLTRDSAGPTSMYSDEYTLVAPNSTSNTSNSQQVVGSNTHTAKRENRWSINSNPHPPSLSRRSSAPQSGFADSYTNLASLNNGLDDMSRLNRLRERHSLSDLSQDKLKTEDQSRTNSMSNISVKVSNESPILAELKTNVIVKDEFTLVTDLTYHLAQRYNRAEGRILVKIDHSACLALGGAFDPCYILTVSAVASQMQPAANKRNATLIQAFMADILSVSPERGIVKFDPIDENNLATGGHTISGMVEQLSRRRSEDYTTNPVITRVSNGIASRKNINGGRTATNAPDPVPQKPITVLTNGIHRPMSNMSSSNRHSRISEEAESDEDDDFKTPVSPLNLSDSQFRPASSDGLRMNGISGDAPSRYNRLTNGRPKTVGSRLIYTQKQEKEEDADPIRAKHIPIDPTRGLTATATKATMAKGTARQVSNERGKTEQKSLRPGSRTSSINAGSAFLDSNSPTLNPSRPGTRDGGPERYDSKLDARASERRASLGANSSVKRRSTITATPKVVPVAPPEPKDELAYSIRETRSLRETTRNLLGKRKSFLKAFSKRQQQQQAAAVANANAHS